MKLPKIGDMVKLDLSNVGWEIHGPSCVHCGLIVKVYDEPYCETRFQIKWINNNHEGTCWNPHHREQWSLSDIKEHYAEGQLKLT